MSNWIPAKERLPVEGKDVFIEFDYDWGYTNQYHFHYYDIGQVVNGEWRGGNYFNIAKNPKVRFWMEIPPIPEGSESNCLS